MLTRHDDHRLARGFARGLIGSLVGLAAMDLYSRGMKALASRYGSENGSGNRNGSGQKSHALDDIAIDGIKARKDEPATEAVARLAVEAVTDGEPTDRTRARLGQVVHWGYGAAVGGLYGLLRCDHEDLDLPAGAGYGAALWLIGDELMVPLLGLAKGPTANGVGSHAQALGAHLVYGLATSGATHALRRIV
jgi:hypothetical protein